MEKNEEYGEDDEYYDEHDNRVEDSIIMNLDIQKVGEISGYSMTNYFPYQR